jgi:hypothetical protein
MPRHNRKGVVDAQSLYRFAGEGSVQPKRTMGHGIVTLRASTKRASDINHRESFTHLPHATNQKATIFSL